MSTNILYIWSPNEVLLKKVRENDQEGGAQIVENQIEFDKIENFTTYKRIFLLVELSWKKHALTEFYGLKILEQIRFKKANCPIYLCSFMPKERFQQKSRILKVVLNTPGHFFLQLPSFIWDFKPCNEEFFLSNKMVEDIIYHCFDIKGSIDEQFHHLKDRVEKENPKPEIDKSFEEIAKLIPEEAHSLLEKIKIELFESINNNRQIPIPKLIGSAKLQVLTLLPESEKVASLIQKITEWQVLCIDDNPRILETLRSQFNKRGISCLTAQSGEEAFDLLQKDYLGELEPTQGKHSPQNSITAVICDLRFENQDGKWHRWQGYDIIDFIHKNLKNFVAFFVLTSKKGTIIRQAQKSDEAFIHWFAKEDILNAKEDSVFDFFASQVRKSGQAIFESISQTPSGKYWKTPWKGKIDFPLQQYYRYHRLSASYQEKETQVNDFANQYIEAAERVADRFFKNVLKVENLDFDSSFKSGLYAPPGDEKAMSKFYTKLIGRRIAIGLHFKGWDLVDISDILKHQELRGNTADRQLFNSYLALSTNLKNEIPGHLLVEEKNWLEQDLKISLNSNDLHFYNRLRDILANLQDQLREKDCPHDFVDDEKIAISNKEHASKYLDLAFDLAIKYDVWETFSKPLISLVLHNRR